MSLWTRDHIVNKWPAARLVGPNVTKEQALDYIWRTDHALQFPRYCTNDRSFDDELARWLGYSESSTRADFEAWEQTLVRRGQLPGLQYLSSQWVACCYIFGPHGPVAPNGEVRLAKNFGKWPSIESVEQELRILSEVFPWLSFVLALWDSEDEAEAVTRGEEPTFAWELSQGSWERRPATRDVFKGIPIPQEPDLDVVVASVARGFPAGRETTWHLPQLDKMWGHRLKGESHE